MQAVNFDWQQLNLNFGEVIIDCKSVYFDWSAVNSNFAVVNFDWQQLILTARPTGKVCIKMVNFDSSQLWPQEQLK